MNAYSGAMSGGGRFGGGGFSQYRPQSMVGVGAPDPIDRGMLANVSRGLFGGSAEIQDPFYAPSGQTYSQLASLLSGGGLGGVDPRMQRSFGLAEQGIGDIMGGQALSQMLAPTLQRFQQQVLPQTLGQVAGRGMSRGRSALPGYATQAAERLGMDALAQQAALIPQALQIAQALSGMPAQTFLGGLGQLASARGTMVQRGAMEGLMPYMGRTYMQGQQGQPGQQDWIGGLLQAAPAIGGVLSAIPAIGPVIGGLVAAGGTIGSHYYNQRNQGQTP